MDSISLATIIQRVAESHGDWIEEAVTTAINADNLVVSTNLNKWDYGRDDWFNRWWCYITDEENITIHRQVSDYATSGGQVTVRGAVLTDDGTDLATFNLFRYSRDNYVRAINETKREIYPALHKRFTNNTLITGNILPNAHFEDQATTGTPDKYTLSNVTGTAETTIIRGGAKSVKLTASAANGYMYINSSTYPRLKDLMNQTVSLYCWARCDDADDDANIEIYTKQADGTEQTLTSTTACYEDQWVRLELEDQALNDDLDVVEIRFRVVTSSNDVYFDNARLVGRDMTEYLLPDELDDANIDTVRIQTSGVADEWCDDLKPQNWQVIHDYYTKVESNEKWLCFRNTYYSERQIEITATAPFTALSAATDAIVIDQHKLNLLIPYARYKLNNIEQSMATGEDESNFRLKAGEALAEYYRLAGKMSMPNQPIPMKMPRI